MNTSLVALAEREAERLIADRRHLHRNPELSFQEYRTSAFIQNALSEMGVEYSVVAQTGVVAHIGSGEHCVALRADIDALPIDEEADVPFRSCNAGVMHACGHDAHTAMLLAAARALKQREAELGGVVKLLFQPGEEKLPGGASIIIREGALANPVPFAIFGQHVDPEASAGALSYVEGPMMASADELYWTVRGRSGHAAQPHLSVDPVLAAAAIIVGLQPLVSRSLDPFAPGVLSICSIHGGHATNVIPDVVELKGTLRSMDEEWRHATLAAIDRNSKALAATVGATVDFSPILGYPPLINDPSATALARAAGAMVVGAERVLNFSPKMWAEDFAYYGKEIPAAFWMLGIRSPEQSSTPGLHNSKFVIDEAALPIGAAALATTALVALGQRP